MRNPNKPSPAHNLLKQLLTLFPNTPTLTLAKKAYNLHLSSGQMWREPGT